LGRAGGFRRGLFFKCGVTVQKCQNEVIPLFREKASLISLFVAGGRPVIV
jgi:hypothetical protein